MSKNYGTLKDENGNEFYPTPRRDTGIKQGAANLFSNVFSCWVQEKTGAICIRIGTSKRALHNVMLHIHGYFYHYTGLTDFDAGVYYYSSTSSFYSPMYRIQNKSTLNKIRFGTDPDGFVYLILGDITSYWLYDAVYIDSVMLGIANTGSYRFIDGWEYKMVTDFTGWTLVNCGEIDTLKQGVGFSWTDISNNLATYGLIKSIANGNEVTIGSQNTSFCHIYNSANIPFYFNKGIYVNGRSVEGYNVIYDNPSGSNGTIGVTANISAYRRIYIAYKNNDNQHFGVTIEDPVGKEVSLISAFVMTGNYFMIKGRRIRINDTQITTLGYGEGNYRSGFATEDVNNTYIYKVLGYKFG